MMHPVGGLAPSVYWRRRILLLAAVLLVILTFYAIFLRGGGSEKPRVGGGVSSTSRSSSAAPSLAASTSAAKTSAVPSKTPSSAAPVVKNCATAQLKITAATDAKAYPASAKPKLALVVTNTGPAPCITDLSDAQIELRVYNGSARVWGSHDCAIQPGTSRSTLPVGQATRRTIEWSGLSSQPACAGVRQRVAAGTYTLFAYLAGRQGTTTTFTLAG